VFAAMHSEGKPVTGPVIVEMKITDKCTFYKGWSKETTAEGDIHQMILL